MARDNLQDKKASQKELARKMRREAYQRAKEQRAKDPRYLAMKEAAKQQRREAYQKVKELRKGEAAAQKAKKVDVRAEERAARDAELMKLLSLGIKGSTEVN